MAESPLITIGLPVYNSEKYIEQSLKSLLTQTYTDFILIISDNASTDSTPAICKKYSEADSRIKYYRNEKNIGNPSNFNRIFKLTNTKYLKWSTADDYWDPTFLADALEIMEADPTIALCYPKTNIVDAEGKNIKPYEDNLHLMDDDPVIRFQTLLKNIGLAHQHLGLIRTSMLGKTHLLGMHVASDINLLSELTLYGKFYELPKRVFYRRFHKTSGSWERRDMKHQAKHYLATGSKFTGLTAWRGHKAFFAEVSGSPLPFAARLALYRYLAKRAYWDHKLLASELWLYLRYKLSRKTIV